ncbi:bifunctional diaminohydroxyphosphoribosylaminopyrimidine deaminase/5-amino-6-(5-phosphoribosylamino)uracil reductase RibD [Corynebacterium sp.]|uniref:bifunctional diaminohydroxyphosphoribosylaminopyrimidine deaminase/5-amino-6-(5-phosphoribosylamino)uracil reductase RibD n=1 Tax=Corynebacterium sp. TaxID=1720 RepID=UPI003736BE9A
MRPKVSDAVAAGRDVRGTTSPNPPVGCALYDEHGALITTGGTEPAGGAHAEVVALRKAGERARGATAVVTLEPCNHTGRTGPCSHALADAGIARVIYLTPDPNPQASGGAEYLRSRGVEVLYHRHVVADLIPWLTSMRLVRPAVTIKFAASVDGFTAAPDGTSQWITGPAAREHVHGDRARRDAIVVGTGTVLADDPSLTARHPDGSLRDHQPRRVVVGARDVPEGNLTRLGFEQFPTIDAALSALYDEGVRDLLVEGGAGLATSFVEAGYVDCVQAYVAPMLMGAGRGVLARGLGGTLTEMPRFDVVDTDCFAGDVLIEMVKDLDVYWTR